MKKEIIKNSIKPFFKAEGFTNKGVKFHKNLGMFYLSAEIQSQRYYKEPNSENFRIILELYMQEFTENIGEKDCFCRAFIPENSQWIEVNPQSDLEKISCELKTELQNQYQKILKFTNIDNLIDSFKSDIYDFRYIFLLKKFQPENFPVWQKQMEMDLEDIEKNRELILMNKEKQNLRPESLDKKILLEGIQMKLMKLNQREEKIQKLLSTSKIY